MGRAELWESVAVISAQKAELSRFVLAHAEPAADAAGVPRWLGGQGLFESGWVKGALRAHAPHAIGFSPEDAIAALGNNVWGIKGKGQRWETSEFRPGDGYEQLRDGFAAWPSLTEACTAWAKKITTGRYADVLRVREPWLTAMVVGAWWATSPTYPRRLLSVAARAGRELAGPGERCRPGYELVTLLPTSGPIVGLLDGYTREALKGHDKKREYVAAALQRAGYLPR